MVSTCSESTKTYSYSSLCLQLIFIEQQLILRSISECLFNSFY